MTQMNGNGTSYIPQQNPAQIFAGQPNQQQYQQPQQIVVEQQPQQQYQQQLPYVDGQVSMKEQNFNLSEAGKELINMIANAQQPQQQMVQLPNGQIVPVVPQQQNESFFNTWYGKGALIAGGGLAGYGIARMTSGPSGNDIAAFMQGAQTLSESNGSDVIKAIKSFF